MYEKEGLPAEKYLMQMIRMKYLRPGIRKYKPDRVREKEAKQKGKHKKEITTQQTIALEEAYPDGICKTRGDRYTKMIEFTDVNYALLDDEERRAVLEAYSKCINSFNPNVHCQLFLFNRRAGRERLEKRFTVEPQGDGRDDVREEFSGMLRDLSVTGTNGIAREKYLILGVKAKSLKEARDLFEGTEKAAQEKLAAMGCKVRTLSGAERMDVLRNYYDQGAAEADPYNFGSKKRTVRDYLAPKKMDFRTPGAFKSGSTYGCVKYLDVIAPKMSDDVMRSILQIDASLCVSVHFQTIEPMKAIRMLKHSLSEIQKSKIEEQKKAVRGGWDMDIIPSDLILYEEATKSLLENMNTSNQKLIQTCILIACFGRTKEELRNVNQRLLSIVQEANCALIDLTYDQENAMNAASPIGINEVLQERNLTTKNLAIMEPFLTLELFQKENPLYYGLNALSGNMIMADRKELRNPNGVILGTPGSGKSFSAKREILGSYLMTTDDVLICDPEGEYYPLVRALGGEVVKLATDSKQYLNPMDIQLSHKGDREALKLKSDFIITLCDVIAGGRKGLENDEKGIIDYCVDQIYEEYFRDPRPEKMPILEDLYNELMRYEPVIVVSDELALDARAKAVRIANSLVLYVHGSQNFFNHRTNVDSQNRTVCFDIRDLGNQLKELGMLIVQDAVWNRVSRNRERNRATRYYCDEFHLLLREGQTAKYAVEMWKRFRKWGGIPTGLTQNVTDFLKSPEIEGILGNSDFIYLLNQSPNDQEILADRLQLSEAQLRRVTNSPQGCGLIIYGGAVIAFEDRYPTNTKTFAIMNTKPAEETDSTQVGWKGETA
ncbi:MAG: conjugal transfer protein TraE [Acetatifactor sp.]|nr:conjugal transfer protein TraE [Acetatifactor sp.]